VSPDRPGSCRPARTRAARLALPGTVMPRTCIDTADAIELAETLQLIARWLTADPERLAASLLDFIGHPAYGPDALHADLDRFTFLLGGNDGEFLFGDDPDLPATPPRPRSELTNKNHPRNRQARSELTNNRGQNSRTKPPLRR